MWKFSLFLLKNNLVDIRESTLQKCTLVLLADRERELRADLELLTKCSFMPAGGVGGKKKDALRRQSIPFIIVLRFKAVADKRQWSSAASKPRRKTRVLGGEGSLAPDLALAQGVQIVRLILVFQISPNRGAEVGILQFPCPPSVLLAEASSPHRAALAVLPLRPVFSVQPAGGAVEYLQPQLLPVGT